MAHYKSKPRRVLAYAIKDVGKVKKVKGTYSARVLLESGDTVQYEGRFDPKPGDMCVYAVLSHGLNEPPVFMEQEDFHAEFFRH